jgi:hypothetical protein
MLVPPRAASTRVAGMQLRRITHLDIDVRHLYTLSAPYFDVLRMPLYYMSHAMLHRCQRLEICKALSTPKAQRPAR